MRFERSGTAPCPKIGETVESALDAVVKSSVRRLGGLLPFRGSLRPFAGVVLCASVSASMAIGESLGNPPIPNRQDAKVVETQRMAVGILAESLSAKAVKIDRLDADFAFLPDLVKGKRIVGIGEETHGTSEFTMLQWNLIRQLADLGFRDIALEVSADQVVALEAFLNGDPTVSAEAAALPFGIRGTVETAKAFTGLREYNMKVAPEKKIRIWPVDILDVSIQLRTLKAVFGGRGVEAVRATEALERFGSKSIYVPEPGQALTEADARRAQAAIGTLGAIMADSVSTDGVNALGTRLALLAVERQIEFVLATLRSGADLQDPKLSLMNANIMDRAMAEAVMTLVREGKRVVYLAHNAHVQKGGVLAGGSSISILETSAGIIISSLMEKDYIVIGLKTGKGFVSAAKWDLSGGIRSTPLDGPVLGSFEEGLMSASRGNSLFVDLREMPIAKFAFPERLVGACYESGDVHNMTLAVPGKSYDAVIFVPETKNSVLLPRPQRKNP